MADVHHSRVIRLAEAQTGNPVLWASTLSAFSIAVLWMLPSRSLPARPSRHRRHKTRFISSFAAAVCSFTTASAIRSGQAICCSWLRESNTKSKTSPMTLRSGVYFMALRAARFPHRPERWLRRKTISAPNFLKCRHGSSTDWRSAPQFFQRICTP